jgi:GntR family transcriptional regulator, transcriptional repressor for pyruvate dehydrogenase complex
MSDSGRELASDAVHDRLRAAILAGTIAPGEAIPSERSLAEAYGVNRHAVREALKRLQQSGLIRIAQGGATRVRDWQREAGLDLLLGLMDGADDPPQDLIRAVLEMRASVGADAARRCAERATSGERNGIELEADALAERIEASAGRAEEAYAQLWELIVSGSGNIAYRLALNSLNAALTAHPELGSALVPRSPQLLRSLGSALGSGHALASAEAATAMLESDLELAGAVSRPPSRP